MVTPLFLLFLCCGRVNRHCLLSEWAGDGRHIDWRCRRCILISGQVGILRINVITVRITIRLQALGDLIAGCTDHIDWDMNDMEQLHMYVNNPNDSNCARISYSD
jgi:hypothetical protein